MSMITELIERLKNYAQILEDTSTNKGSADLMCIKTMREAADVIYELSSKLHAINMERSSQYYYGGWIPVSERLPEDGEIILFSTKTDRVYEGRYFDDNTDRQWYSFRDDTFAWNNVITAWMPLPEPYSPNDEE